jgi:ketosteroid isomerase-like protein
MVTPHTHGTDMTRSPSLVHCASRFLVAAIVGCGGSLDATTHSALGASDSAAIRRLQDRYVASWLADDTAGVLALFEPDAMILPPGRRPITGIDSIRAYWWPRDGSSTHILTFTLSMDELQGAPPFAFTRGESTLGWTYSKAGTTSRSTSRSLSLTMLRRSASGEWRIARQMWGPALPP